MPELLIFLGAIALYTYQLGTESFWIDEILSVESAQGELNLNRPLYFLLLRLWMRMSTDDAWLRSLSLLFGLGCVVLTYFLGRKLANKQAGRIAALLLTLSPLAINHAQEVRFYAMSTFLGLAGSLCLSNVLSKEQTKQKQGPFPSLIAWILCRCLGFLTAQPNILLLPPDLILIGWNTRSKTKPSHAPQLKETLSSQRIYWLCSLTLLLVPTAIILSDVIPEFLTFLSYTSHADTAHSPSVASLIGKLAALTAWPLRGPTFSPSWAQPLYSHLFNFYSLLTVGVLFTGLFINRKKPQTSQLTGAILWGFLPILSIFAIAQIHPILWEDRYALISAPYILILLAAIWTQLWQKHKAIALTLTFIYLLTVSGPLLRYYTTHYRANWQGLAQQLSHDEQPGDPVIVYPGSFVEIMDYYYDGSANFLPIDDVITAEDVEPAKLTKLALNTDKQRLWVICPTVEQWDQKRETLTKQLKQNGFEIQQSSYLTDQWHWGPTLHLFVQKQ